jgi:hypothetical protein
MMKDYLWLSSLKVKLRKWTTPFHILAGLLIAALIPYYPVAAVLLLSSMGFLEYWQEKNTGDTGVADFWEIVVATFIGSGIALVLKLVGVI